MKALILLLAAIFFVVGLLYGLGMLQLFAHASEGHHYKHMILFWLLALLCLVWARFVSNPRTA
jgi:hypothetical protein